MPTAAHPLAVPHHPLEALQARKQVPQVRALVALLGARPHAYIPPVVGVFDVSAKPLQDAVSLCPAVVDYGRCGAAVAACAPGFLHEAFEAPRGCPVDDEADGGVVDAHAEGVGCDYYCEGGLGVG